MNPTDSFFILSVLSVLSDKYRYICSIWLFEIVLSYQKRRTGVGQFGQISDNSDGRTSFLFRVFDFANANGGFE